MKKVFVLIIVSLFLISAKSQNADYKTKLDSIDKYIVKAMTDWGIPGMAIGIVKDGEVIFTKGYGVRETGKPEKVDENTMFGIASNTKAFVSASLATLVDEGKISWDDKVRKYLPYFQLYDPYVSENMTIRDLLCHRAGFETFSGDLLWHSTSYSREDIIKRARFLKPVYGFRAHYGYSNLMFLTAGEIIPAVTGISLDDYLKQTFFTPLGMATTNSTIREHKNITNLAQPHDWVNDKITKLKYISWDNIAAAGGINSTVTDMSKWIKLQLSNGTLDGKKYFSKETQEEMWSAQMVNTISGTDKYFFPTKHFHLYGMGWDLFDYLGKKVVNHSGGLDGMISQVAMVPEEKLGFVILTNSNNYLPYFLMYTVIDVFLENKGLDYGKIVADFVKRNKEEDKKKQEEEEKARNKNSKPTLPLESYVGTYGGELYGDAKVTLEKGKLKVQFIPAPEFESVLEHWQYDIFTVKFNAFPSLPTGKVNFIINQDGKVEEMKIDVPNPDFYFTELEFKKKD
ncbi:MAG: hypothetical protein A2W91_01255 [Bacteroidetes bacterium GWF2_38_335]|nr:MAG: hypothetical protein A2W91_01255 [Bacteroidetes bacterium GWF2_38_335]OFY80988.1 MAG: hypothetical protein A2281_13010 [Bacteroidetes bacterium RIFOXYA12_FULL_38_20]